MSSDVFLMSAGGPPQPALPGLMEDAAGSATNTHARLGLALA